MQCVENCPMQRDFLAEKVMNKSTAWLNPESAMLTVLSVQLRFSAQA